MLIPGLTRALLFPISNLSLHVLFWGNESSSEGKHGQVSITWWTRWKGTFLDPTPPSAGILSRWGQVYPNAKSHRVWEPSVVKIESIWKIESWRVLYLIRFWKGSCASGNRWRWCETRGRRDMVIVQRGDKGRDQSCQGGWSGGGRSKLYFGDRIDQMWWWPDVAEWTSPPLLAELKGALCSESCFRSTVGAAALVAGVGPKPLLCVAFAVSGP